MGSSIHVFGLPARALRLVPAQLRRGATLTSLVVVLLFVTLSLLAPWIAPYEYNEQLRDLTFAAPSAQHWFGTDDLGRDVWTRILYGGRISLTVAVVVELVELLFGVTLGLLAGYRGGWLDNLIMRVADMMFAFPDILLAILITGVLGPSIRNVFLALALVGWPQMVRLVRGQALALRGMEYVQSAQAMGASDARILIRHLLPNLMGPIVVAATVGIGSVILAEATLSFLGLGVQPPYPSWGSMINEAWEHRRSAPILTLWPAGMLALTVAAFNFFGDGLRDWLDPRQTVSQ